MFADLRAAFSFLTIIPLGYADGRKPGWSFTWYPIVGLVIGTILAFMATISPFESYPTAFLILFIWVVITGGLHLDGFGDSCDGLFATVDLKRRLEIMKDPRTGSWAVIGLILLLLGKFIFLPLIPPLLLIIPPILGRWVMVLAVYSYRYARSSGLGGYFRDGLGQVQVGIATVFTFSAILVFSLNIVLFIFMVAIGLGIVWGVGRWASKRLGGGITGDVYGALCELTELACLIGLGLWASL